MTIKRIGEMTEQELRAFILKTIREEQQPPLTDYQEENDPILKGMFSLEPDLSERTQEILDKEFYKKGKVD